MDQESKKIPRWLKYGLIFVGADFFISFIPLLGLPVLFLNSLILTPLSFFFPKFYLAKSAGLGLYIYPVGWAILIMATFFIGAIVGLIAEKKPKLLHRGVDLVFILILSFMLFSLLVSFKH